MNESGGRMDPSLSHAGIGALTLSDPRDSLMLACRAIDRGNPLTVAHLFGGFSQRTVPLIVVGLIYTGLAILILLIVAGMMIAIFGVAILGMLTGAVDPSQTGIALGSVVVAVLLGILFFLLLLLPLIMAISSKWSVGILYTPSLSYWCIPDLNHS